MLEIFSRHMRVGYVEVFKAPFRCIRRPLKVCSASVKLFCNALRQRTPIQLSRFPYSNSEQALMVALSTLLVVRMVHVLVQLTSRPISSPVICVAMAPSRQDHISFVIGFVKSKQNLPLFCFPTKLLWPYLSYFTP